MEGFQKPASRPGQTDVTFASVRLSNSGAICSCGWACSHHRRRIVEDKAERHIQKRHHGRAMRW